MFRKSGYNCIHLHTFSLQLLVLTLVSGSNFT